MEKKKTVDVILRLPKAVHAKAKKLAEKEHLSLNSLIVRSLDEKCNDVAKKSFVVSK